nr:hypothetical protein [Streptomyces californicus]
MVADVLTVAGAVSDGGDCGVVVLLMAVRVGRPVGSSAPELPASPGDVSFGSVVLGDGGSVGRRSEGTGDG